MESEGQGNLKAFPDLLNQTGKWVPNPKEKRILCILLSSKPLGRKWVHLEKLVDWFDTIFKVSPNTAISLGSKETHVNRIFTSRKWRPKTNFGSDAICNVFNILEFFSNQALHQNVWKSTKPSKNGYSLNLMRKISISFEKTFPIFPYVENVCSILKTQRTPEPDFFQAI